jgi:hypothetical protein
VTGPIEAITGPLLDEPAATHTERG